MKLFDKLLSTIGLVRQSKHIELLDLYAKTVDDLHQHKHQLILSRDYADSVNQTNINQRKELNKLSTKQAQLKSVNKSLNEVNEHLNKRLTKLQQELDKQKKNVNRLLKKNKKLTVTIDEYNTFELETKVAYLEAYNTNLINKLEYLCFGSILPKAMKQIDLAYYAYPHRRIKQIWNESKTGVEIYIEGE